MRRQRLLTQGGGTLFTPCPALTGLSRSDEGSPSKYAEALLGKEAINRNTKQFLECSNQVGGRAACDRCRYRMGVFWFVWS